MSRTSRRSAYHVSLGDEFHAVQLRQGARVDLVRLHLGVADRFRILRVAEKEINTLGHEKVADPVPASDALNHCAMGPGILAK